MVWRFLLFALFALACGSRSALEQLSSVSLVGAGAGGNTGTNTSRASTPGGTSFAGGGTLLLGGNSSSGGATAPLSADASIGPCVESMCTSGGWCWLNPLPQGNSLFDVIVRNGEFWAVGDDGLVLRGDGEHWLRCPSPTTESLRGSWFSPNGVLWTVGTGGVVLSFDGTSWTQHYSEAGLFLNDVHGSSDNDVWVVGDRVVLHFDGINWDRKIIDTDGALYCVWVHSINDIWVAGTEVWHFDGRSWREIYASENPARAIWGDDFGDVWLAAGDALHCDRLGCGSVPSSVGEQFDVWGTSSSNVWSIGSGGGLHWDGVSWTTFDVPTSLTSVSGGTPFGLVAVGHFGRMFRRTGSEWVELRRAIGTVWTDVWGASESDIWFSGNSMAHYDGLGISITPTSTSWGLQTVRGVASNDVWAVGCNGTIIHWDGRTWADFTVSPWPQWDVCLWSVWSDSSRSALASGSQGIVLQWDGSSWFEVQPLPSAATSRSLFGISSNLFAVDDSGDIWQRTASGWQAVTGFVSKRANALWGASNSDLWVAGEYSKQGFSVHYSNGQSSQQQVDTTTLTGLWGTAADDVWLTGDGNVFHFDGRMLTERPSGVHISNSKIWVSPSGTRWMVGGNAILRHAP